MYGARSIADGGGVVVCGCGVIGLVIGMLAGYAAAWFDRFANLLAD